MENFKKWMFLLLFLILTFLLGRVILSEKGIKGYVSLKKRVEEMEAENRILKGEKERLELEIRRLKSDPYYIEKIARELYDMVKENEIVIKFANEDSDSVR